MFDSATYSSVAGMDSMVFSAAFVSPAMASNTHTWLNLLDIVATVMYNMYLFLVVLTLMRLQEHIQRMISL